MEDNFNNINRVKATTFINNERWDNRYYEESTPATPIAATPAAALGTTIQSQSQSHPPAQQQQQQPAQPQRNCNPNARSSPSLPEMKFVAPAVSRNMNSLIFLTTDMHRNDYFTTTSTSTGPESASGTASASTTLTRPQQSTTTTTASIRMVPSKASQSRSIVNAATAIARADAHHHCDHDHEDLAASAVSTASQQAAAATAEGNSGRAMSQSMPFPSSHVHRTDSEVQLLEDEEMAERRDLTMFYRLVNGIRERQTNHQQNLDGSISSSGGGNAAGQGLESFPIDQLPPPSHYYGERIPQGNQGATAACALETERRLAHIIQTRNSKLEDAPPGPATAAAAAAAAALEAEGGDLEWPMLGYGNDQVAAIHARPTPTADRSSLAFEVHPPVHQGEMYAYHHTPPTAPNMMSMSSSAYDAGMDHQHEDPVAATGDDIDEDDEGIFDMEL